MPAKKRPTKKKEADKSAGSLDQYRATGLAEGRAVVVNVRREPYDVYVGRRHPSKPGEDGYFGNETDGDSMDEYISGFLDRILEEPGFRARVEGLKGKRLGCWCWPRACHAMVISCWANLEASDRAMLLSLHREQKQKPPSEKESVWELNDWAREGRGL